MKMNHPFNIAVTKEKKRTYKHTSHKNILVCQSRSFSLLSKRVHGTPCFKVLTDTDTDTDTDTICR